MESSKSSFFGRLGQLLRRWATAFDYDPVVELHRRVRRLEDQTQREQRLPFPAHDLAACLDVQPEELARTRRVELVAEFAATERTSRIHDLDRPPIDRALIPVHNANDLIAANNQVSFPVVAVNRHRRQLAP